MELKSTRKKEELREVLKDVNAYGPDVAYWVFKDVSENKWENVTVVTPGEYNGEFPKTYGHYHTSSDRDEIYKVVNGEGVFLLQKKYIDENGEWIPERVEKVYLIKANVGDEITVPKEYAHSWSNIGELPLITLDNWRDGHIPSDYEQIKKLRGLAYYLVNENDEVKAVPNSEYKDIPDLTWITSKEFNNLSS